MAMHEDEVSLSDEAAGALIADQFPAWAQEPLRRLPSSGTVNAIFRVGDRHAARFPLTGTDVEGTRQQLEAEASASRDFARACPVPAPAPVGLGLPGHGYPLPWSVQTWVPGVDASQQDAASSEAFAGDLAALIAALRHAETGGRTFSGRNRGGRLRDHDAWVHECLRRSEHLLDVASLRALWADFSQLPRTDPDVMAHGDLIPANVLVADGRLTGVLDTGGFTPADPALDLIAGWHLLDDGPRAEFRDELLVGDLEWERSKAWAFEQALGAVWYYVDTNRTMAQMGQRTLTRIVAATQRASSAGGRRTA